MQQEEMWHCTKTWKLRGAVCVSTSAIRNYKFCWLRNTPHI